MHQFLHLHYLAFSFTKPKSARDWRSFGAFSAFIVALFTEMYGFPLTIYLLSGWLQSRFPRLSLTSHDAGHLWWTLLGMKGDPHSNPLHLLRNVFILGGLVPLAAAWHVPSLWRRSLLSSPPRALEGINGKLASSNLRVILTEGEQNQVRVTLVPTSGEESAPKEPNWWLHGILLLLTFATTTWAGAMHQGVNILQDPANFAVGLPYSIGLLLILGGHELGHYFAARRHRIQVTPPYFVPAPFALGTFGAFISMRGLVRDRRALFDVAVAGPLAGLVFAIPALLVGLQYSKLVTDNASPGLLHSGVDIGSSFLMAILSKLALGPAVPHTLYGTFGIHCPYV